MYHRGSAARIELVTFGIVLDKRLKFTFVIYFILIKSFWGNFIIVRNKGYKSQVELLILTNRLQITGEFYVWFQIIERSSRI